MKNHMLFSIMILGALIPTDLQSMDGAAGKTYGAAYLSAAGVPIKSSDSTKDAKETAEQTKQSTHKLTGSHGMSEEYRAQHQLEGESKDGADGKPAAAAGAGAGAASTHNKSQPEYSNPMLNRTNISSSLASRMLVNPPDKVKLLIDRIKKVNVEDLDLSEKVLFFVGPSGTGKTCTAQAIATECGNLSCYIYPAISVGNEYIQSGNKNLQRIFEDAALEAKTTNKPVVIVLDELQKLFENHTNEKDPSSSFITALWSILDSYANNKVIFIGIFNPIKCEVPSQIKTRFGRVIIAIDLPDKKDRAETLTFHINQYKTKKFDTIVLNSINTLAGMTEGWCRRELAECVKEASDISEVKKNSVVTLGDCYEAITVMNNLRTRTQHVDKTTWGEWTGKNWKFLTGSVLSAAAIGTSLYLGARSLNLQTAAQASAEKSNIFNRFMTLISYQLNWDAAQKAAQPKSVWSWSDVAKHSESTAKGWNPAEIVRHLLRQGFTLAELGLDQLSEAALALMKIDKKKS